MRKILLLLLLLLTSSAVYAANVVVESLTDIDASNPQKPFSVKVLEQAEFSDIVFEENSVINGEVIKLVGPKRGNKDAYIVIRPESYTKDGATVDIKDEYIEAKVIGYSKPDFKKTVLDAGLTVGGHFVKGLGQIFYFSKGLISPNEGQSRAASAVQNVYKNSPFVYIEKGKEVQIEAGDFLVLEFYHSDVPKWRILKRKK